MPFNEYVNEARPPEPRTPSENALFAVPNKPVVGVAIVRAVATVTVKLAVVAVAPFASVTLTDTVEEPATVGVPEIVPVDELKFKPFTKVPFNEYVNEARPPAPGTASENALFAVPNKPVEGVGIDKAPATVNATAEEVVDAAALPLALLVTLTLNEPASVVANGLMV